MLTLLVTTYVEGEKKVKGEKTVQEIKKKKKKRRIYGIFSTVYTAQSTASVLVVWQA